MQSNDDWERFNLRHLGLMLAATRLAIEAAGKEGSAAASAEAEREEALRGAAEVAAAMSAPPRTEALAHAFELSEFELSVLLVCACWELDRGELATWLDPGAGPTLAGVMALLPQPHWSACTPNAPLRSARLIEVGSAETLMNRTVRIAEPVLHYLKGAPSPDPRLVRLSISAPAPLALPLEAAHAVERLLDLDYGPGLLQLVGRPWITLAAAAAIGRALGVPVRQFRAADLPGQREELDELRVLLARDVRLGAVIPVFLVDRAAPRSCLDALEHCIDDRIPVALLASPEPVRLDLTGLRTVRLAGPTHEERLDLWRRCLGSHAEDVGPLLDQVVVQFRLDPDQVETASDAWLEGGAPDAAPDADRLWDACIDVSTPQLDGLADHVPGRDGLRELVVPNAQREILESIVAQMRQRSVVDVEWGMHPPGRRGGGIAVLFSGPSGTGKTLAAEGLAWELRLPLFRVDLSNVVSKYIGETEKHLSKLFDAAEAGGSVLLFDEADALFGKRSQVSSAHDRYANIEVSYLLQRLESYSGLAILTTNHRANIDEAFLRRVRFVVSFPTPGVRQRGALWQRVFSEQVPLGELDHDLLAEVELTGGSIRNAALVAASLAAEAGGPVGMPEVLRAIRLELGKQGRTIPMHLDGAE